MAVKLLPEDPQIAGRKGTFDHNALAAVRAEAGETVIPVYVNDGCGVVEAVESGGGESADG